MTDGRSAASASAASSTASSQSGIPNADAENAPPNLRIIAISSQSRITPLLEKVAHISNKKGDR